MQVAHGHEILGNGGEKGHHVVTYDRVNPLKAQSPIKTRPSLSRKYLVYPKSIHQQQNPLPLDVIPKLSTSLAISRSAAEPKIIHL